MISTFKTLSLYQLLTFNAPSENCCASIVKFEEFALLYIELILSIEESFESLELEDINISDILYSTSPEFLIKFCNASSF